MVIKGFSGALTFLRLKAPMMRVILPISQPSLLPQDHPGDGSAGREVNRLSWELCSRSSLTQRWQSYDPQTWPGVSQGLLPRALISRINQGCGSAQRPSLSDPLRG